jgi:hypothetical protein
MNQQFGPLLYTISVWALPAIIAITFHEAAHGFVARLLGDDTAWRLGRVTFNPLKHIDPVGTILLPGLLLFLHSRFCSVSQTGPDQLPGAAQSAARYGLGRSGRPGHKHLAALLAAIGFYLVGYLPDAGAQWLVAPVIENDGNF